MPLLTADEFKKVFTAASRATPEEITWAMDAGKTDLIDLVGKDLVDASEVEPPAAETPVANLKQAYGHLSYANLVFNVSSRLYEGGILTKKHDGVGDQSTVVTEFLKPDQVSVIEEKHREMAVKAVRDYLLEKPAELSAEVDNSSFVPIEVTW